MKRVSIIIVLVLLVVSTLPMTSVLAQEESECVASFDFQAQTWSFDNCTLAEVAAIVAAQQPEQPVTESANAANTTEFETLPADEKAGPGDVTISGVPELAKNYETSQPVGSLDEFVEGGPIVSTLPAGLRLVMGFPGVALTHDEPMNQYQDRFSSLTQIQLDDEKTEIGCGESRFIQVVVGKANVAFSNGMTVQLGYSYGNNHWLTVRCPYTDGELNSDRGLDVTITGYKPGFGNVMIYPAGGYVAEDATLLALPFTHGGYTAGSEGATYLTWTVLDTNTGAYSTYVRTEENGWTLVDTNMAID